MDWTRPLKHTQYTLRALARFARRRSSIVAIAVTLVAIGGAVVLRAQVTEESAPRPPQTPTVSVARAGSLTSDAGEVPLTGTVSARSQARIRTQTQGEVTRVTARAGQRVGAGTVIAELNNASQRADVRQAQASLASARANLAEARAGARSQQRAVLESNLASAREAYDEARVAARNVLFNTRSVLDTAIRIRADQVFNSPKTDDPQLRFNASNLRLATDLEFRRRTLQETIQQWNARVGGVSTSTNLRQTLTDAETVIGTVRTFLEDLTSLVNDLTPNANLSQTTISNWQSALSQARSEVNSVANSVSSARGDLVAKQSQIETARQNLDEAQSGARPEVIQAREAAVQEAQARLASAQARLEDTRIRTPITGTITTLPIEQGDFVQAFTLAAIVANQNSVQIEADISPRDRQRIQVGNAVTIAKQYNGTVTSVSPGVNPDTGKIDMTVGVDDPGAQLTQGDTVRIAVTASTSSTPTEAGPVTLPLSAVKITGTGSVVFTVTDEQRLTAHPVTLGTLSGGSVRVTDGVRPDMEIVTDARGLADGQQVRIAE